MIIYWNTLKLGNSKSHFFGLHTSRYILNIFGQQVHLRTERMRQKALTRPLLQVIVVLQVRRLYICK